MSVVALSLKLDENMRGLMDDNCVLEFSLIKLSAYSMDPEIAVTCTGGHFNQAIFAV